MKFAIQKHVLLFLKVLYACFFKEIKLCLDDANSDYVEKTLTKKNDNINISKKERKKYYISLNRRISLKVSI